MFNKIWLIEKYDTGTLKNFSTVKKLVTYPWLEPRPTTESKVLATPSYLSKPKMP